MGCNCNETTNQGTQYCQECMPSEFHWLVPVSKEPDPFFMDRHHAYIDTNNVIYVLSRDRLRAIKITTSEGNIDLSPYALKEELASKISELTIKLAEGLEGAKYFEGEGIRIDEDNRIHSTVTLTEVNQRLDSLEQFESELSKKANKQQEDWINPTLLNGWTTGEHVNYAPIQYKKDEFGFVHLRGGITNGVDRYICTLPIGYRPKGIVPIIAKKQWSHTAFDWLHLAENGTLSVSNASMPTDTRLYFSAIFLAEN